MIFRPSRTLRESEVQVDPYAAAVIDYNPLEDGMNGLAPVEAAGVVRHAIASIPWPQGTEPEIDRSFTFKGPETELPRADFVLITWTSAEANAMAAVLTPGIWSMPPSRFKGKSWYEYTNQWDSKFRGRSTGRSPAAEDHYIGKYMPIKIGGRSVLLFKSNFHLARDDKSMPVKDMFKQVIVQTGARLVITTGTAGAIGSKLKLGDAVIANTALFKCDGTFKRTPFNKKKFTSGYPIPHNGHVKVVNSKLIAPNAAQLKPERTGHPEVYTTAAELGEPDVIITTDKFEFDDKDNTFGLQKLGAMVEMDDAVLGLACEELGGSTKWLAIRNASDPQMPTDSAGESSAIYNKYGYWTSITSVLACWAMVLDAGR